MSSRLLAPLVYRISRSGMAALVAIAAVPVLPVLLIPPALAQSSEPLAESSAAPTPVPDGYQVVMGDRWSFAVPADWQDALTAPLNPVERIRLVAQLRDQPGQQIVNLVQETYDGSDTDYIQLTIDSLDTLGFTVMEQRSIAVGEWQGMELEVSAPESEPPIRFLQRVVAVAGTGFALTCGGTEAEFESTQAVCANILNSFQIAPVTGDGEW